MNKKVAIVAARRTAVGKFGGALASFSAMDLGAAVIRALLQDTGLQAAMIDEVIMGHVLTAGLGQNTARQAALKAGLPHAVSAYGVNLVCGSGLKAVHLGAQAIATGQAKVVIAGGQESMSNAPFVLPDMRGGKRMGNAVAVDSMLNDGLTDAYEHYHMGITAENLAKKYNISKEEQDKFAVKSQNKAETAQKAGYFQEEIVPLTMHGKKGETTVVNADEGIRYGTDYESLARLKPVFLAGGTVSAGNASGINDGAAGVVMMSVDDAKALKLPVLAVLEAYATSGCDPAIMGIGPVGALQKTLANAAWKLDCVDLIEANEAFAAQALAVMKELKLKEEITNVSGGAIALGHPIGASGCRILVTLVHAMRRLDRKRGLAALCIGGGMGIAAALSRD